MNIRISAIALSLLIGSSFAADPRMEQGAIFEAKGNYEMALGEYRAMLAEDPKNSDAYFAAAEVRVKMKDYSGALANYRLAYKFNPKMSAAYEGAAKVYELLGQKAKAADERAKDPKNHPVVDEDAAIAAAAAPEAASAVSAPAEPAKVAEAPKAETPKAEPVKAEPAKQEPKAEPAPVAEPKAQPAKVAEAPKAEPAKPEPKVEPAKVADALPADPFEKGKVLFAEKKYTEAAKAWREVLKKTPGHAGAYYYAGLTRYEMGEMDKAEFNLKKGLEYKEEGNEANYYLSLIYQKNTKVEQEQKFLVAYLKKAGPTAKNRKNAEERLAAIKSAKAEADKAAAEAKAAAEEAKAAKAETKSEPAKVAEAPKAAETKTVEPKAAPAAETAQPAAPAAEEIAAAEPSIGNANMLLNAKSYEAALQMFKALLEQDLNPDERYYSMLQMGNIYREMRDFHSAVTRYREVVQQFADSDWATEAERALEDAVWLEKHAKELPKRKH